MHNFQLVYLFSMEECDALCTKIVIMVNGRFVCCGSSQHLKNKFGQGYTLICNMKSSLDGRGISTEPLKQFLCSKFPSTIVFDDHQGYCHFQIMDKNLSLGLLFGAMESAKQTLNVEDYAIHQATLEQVFLGFTRNQVAPKEEKPESMCSQICCCCCCRANYDWENDLMCKNLKNQMSNIIEPYMFKCCRKTNNVSSPCQQINQA